MLDRNDAEAFGVAPFLWQFLELDKALFRDGDTIVSQDFDYLFKRLKHGVRRALPLLDALEEFHDTYESLIVILLDLSHQALVSIVNEVVELSQVVDNVVQEMLLEQVAPPLDVVQEAVFEGFPIDT